MSALIIQTPDIALQAMRAKDASTAVPQTSGSSDWSIVPLKNGGIKNRVRTA